jgi:hypothetical protein
VKFRLTRYLTLLVFSSKVCRYHSTLATATGIGAGSQSFDINSGELGEVPLERGIVAVGPGTGDPAINKERIYIGYRALSIESVTASAKRDAASMFDVTFRMLPLDNGMYGKIVDRRIA